MASYGPKFGANTIPVIQMSQIFKKFYAEAGIDTMGRNISNHSGRVKCCTPLYYEGFTEKAVISRSNHRSNAVHTYQREQFKILSDISITLGAPAPHILKIENTSASTCSIKSERALKMKRVCAKPRGFLKLKCLTTCGKLRS